MKVPDGSHGSATGAEQLVQRFENNWTIHAGCRFECTVGKTQA